METALLEKALERPDVYLFVEKLQAQLASEQAQRQHFYETIEENRKMEFINGEIYFQSPVKKQHNTATGNLFKLIDTYATIHDLGFVGIEKILITLTRNDYEPDICFFREAIASSFQPDQMQFPVPDFIVEVLSPSTEKHDRETKFVDYAAHGVPEYWIVDPERRVVEQYVLAGEFYELIFKASEGNIRCRVLEGLVFPIEAIFDRKQNAAVMKKL